jgi:hypothetical protein
VSLLRRWRANRHLDDEDFAEIWSAAAAAGTPTSDPHLAVCTPCRARYASFVGWADRMRDDARAEADDVFPAERLAAQQAQVLRRLESIERPARVIAFPRFSRPVTSTQGHAQRWIATAAAAGLVIGLAAGQFVDIRNTFGHPGPRAENTTARFVQGATAAPGSATLVPNVSDDTLLYGADASLVVRVSTLQAMDDITPRARDLDQPQ